jgi:hypothetical protein
VPVRLLIAACTLALLGASPPPPLPETSPAARPPIRLSFVPHAALFSLLSRQPALVDPEIFLADPAAAAGLGFEQIAHVAGVRTAAMSDDGTAQALDANGRDLGFDLQHWFAASGLVQIDPPDPIRATQRIVLRFANLVPRGRYSLFLVHLESKAGGDAPLDGTARTNSFTADPDGNAGATIVAQQPLPRGSATVLVYHADRKDHGVRVGVAGFDAFRQLIVRVP